MVRREIAPIQKTMQDVQFFERGKTAAEANNYRWDDLKLFLIAAEAGSLRAAARIAGCSLNTIRNRLEQLEHDLGIVLGKRTADGLVLTPEGFELASIARAMRSTGATIERLRRGREQERGGRISFAVTEGLGTFWLMPRLVEFQADNPHLTIDLSCDMRPVDVLFRDTDLAIQLDMPDHPDLVVTRVGTLHLMPFASPAYLAKHGTPHSIQEALSHKLVLQANAAVLRDPGDAGAGRHPDQHELGALLGDSAWRRHRSAANLCAGDDKAGGADRHGAQAAA
jgi:DNA-binding transcriptional LysR family regulator